MTDGRTESLPELRALALGELARPTDRGTLPRPKATLVVHLAHESVQDGAGEVRVDQIGPILLEQVRDLLAHHTVTLLPVLDLAGDPAIDAYEIPEQMRTQVHLRDPFSVLPYSPSPATSCDDDHTRRYLNNGPPGQTRPSNLGPSGRREHRPKTHAGWHTHQTEPGTFTWTSPLGYRYLVDRHGTFHIPEHGHAPDTSPTNQAEPPCTTDQDATTHDMRPRSTAERLMLTTLHTDPAHIQIGRTLNIDLANHRTR